MADDVEELCFVAATAASVVVTRNSASKIS